jgi:hypothetical protein
MRELDKEVKEKEYTQTCLPAGREHGGKAEGHREELYLRKK